MSYVIVYESSTGNTRQLAQALEQGLDPEGCLACGTLDDVDAKTIAAADRVYAGFWTNRGDCTNEVAQLLSGLASKDVFLFGTCGFGADESYFAGVLAHVMAHIPETCQVVGTFMCQGRMPASVRARYQRMASDNPAQAPRMQALIENFDAALDHPNADDCARLQAAVRAAL